MSIISEKGAGMAIKDVLPRLRRERGLTQEDLAKKLFITRQAVSRWETGETAPGIDMTKLIAVTLGVPVTELLEMPEHYCQSCGMMFTAPDQHGHEADGTEVEDFCRGERFGAGLHHHHGGGVCAHGHGGRHERPDDGPPCVDHCVCYDRLASGRRASNAQALEGESLVHRGRE